MIWNSYQQKIANDELVERIKYSLFQSVAAPNKGFYNLLETYAKDHVVTSSIENIIDRINTMLKGYKIEEEEEH